MLITLQALTLAAQASHAAALAAMDPDLDADELSGAWADLPEPARHVFLVQAAATARALGFDVPELPAPPEPILPAVRQLTAEEADADLRALRWIRQRFGTLAAAHQVLEGIERDADMAIAEVLDCWLGEDAEQPPAGADVVVEERWDLAPPVVALRPRAAEVGR